MSTKGKTKMNWPPEKIKQLRKAYRQTQEEFAELLGVGLGTLRFWEQGQGKPTGSALRLLDRIEADLREGRVEQPA